MGSGPHCFNALPRWGSGPHRFNALTCRGPGPELAPNLILYKSDLSCYIFIFSWYKITIKL